MRAGCCIAAYVCLLPGLWAGEIFGTAGREFRPTLPQPGEARDLCALGDGFFRNADFERAERCYREALSLDAGAARAHLGLGRLARLQFRRKAAHASFAAAFRLDPADPEILLAYAEYISIPGVRETLSTALNGPVPRLDSRIEQVSAKLQIDRAVGGRDSRLAGSYRTYELKLSPFLPVDARKYGVVLKASINGSKPLRLLLDSGARGIVLWSKPARSLGLAAVTDSQIGGLGSDAGNAGFVAVARSVEIGDLRFENCPVEVTGRSFVPGADGIIGTEVFQEFLLQLDFWRQTLELVPFADYAPGGSSTGAWLNHDAPASAAPVYHIGHLLALNTTVDGRGGGLFVLDTGSAYNTVPPELLSGRRGISSSLMRGAQGAMGVESATSRVQFRLSGGPTLNDANVVALDLTGMSRKEGAKITGLLGYSALRSSTLTLNYRDGVVQLEPHNRQ